MNEILTAQKTENKKVTHDNQTRDPSAAKTIPRPLVQANRVFLVLSIGSGLLWTPTILVVPFTIGAIALATGKHPIIGFGRQFLGKSRAHYKLESKTDQRFNQWIATILSGISLFAFLTGFPAIGYLAGSMVILAAGVALLGFCVGCYIRYQWQQWQYKRSHGMDQNN